MTMRSGNKDRGSEEDPLKCTIGDEDLDKLSESRQHEFIHIVEQTAAPAQKPGDK